jgi:hypothetical protein
MFDESEKRRYRRDTKPAGLIDPPRSHPVPPVPVIRGTALVWDHSLSGHLRPVRPFRAERANEGAENRPRLPVRSRRTIGESRLA